MSLPDSKADFHMLAFQLLGIEGLPLPRTNWHLKEGQDGYDDPYLTEVDYQTLCNIVCETLPGVSVKAWRESNRGERIAFLQAVLKKRAESAARSEQEHWTAGTFLAKGKELCRRLRQWHIEDFLHPVQFASVQETRMWVRLTFREIVKNVSSHSTSRPGMGMQFYMYADGERDEHGCVGEVYECPDSDTDRSLTMWLLGDFARHMPDAPNIPAADYLRQSFEQLLELPAWTVVQASEDWADGVHPDSRGNAREFMVTGKEIPVEYLDNLSSAAQSLLDTACRSQSDATVTLPIATQLAWEKLSEDNFERLLYSLVCGQEGYENPAWLTKTNASDRGRDISVDRVYRDSLSGVLRHRVIIQCKHWLSKSVGVQELALLRDQMKLWDPRVHILVIATSGRFTSDAVAFIEKHNDSDVALRIEMWPDSHLERLLSTRPDLVRSFGIGPATEKGGTTGTGGTPAEEP